MTTTDGHTDFAYKRNPVKAIREKCLDCVCGSQDEVAKCPVESCALYPFRFGKNPFRAKRRMTDEQRIAATERLRKANSANK